MPTVCRMLRIYMMQRKLIVRTTGLATEENTFKLTSSVAYYDLSLLSFCWGHIFISG